MKKLFTQPSLVKLTTVIAKTFARLIMGLALVPLLLINNFTFANDISRSEVPDIKVNLGEKIAFYSDNLKEQREFFIRLPEGYQKNKRNETNKKGAIKLIPY